MDTDDTSKKRQLEAEGWKIASVTGGAHVSRTLEMYLKLGVEVYPEEVKPEECKLHPMLY